MLLFFIIFTIVSSIAENFCIAAHFMKNALTGGITNQTTLYVHWTLY